MTRMRLAFVGLVVGLGTAVSAQVDRRVWLSAAEFPRIQLKRVVKGDAAIIALGGRLRAVARAYGLRDGELRRMLHTDRCLRVDRKGRLHYGDEIAADLAAAVGQPLIQPDYPLADTFRLHSRSGAKRVIYLDFDGHLVAGTAWNDMYLGGSNLTCAAMDADGRPELFNDAERAAIQRIWQRVVEDFAPFEVDVTTEEPAAEALTRTTAADDRYGVRMVITSTSDWFGYYGGVAYAGAFRDVGDYYKPGLVFSTNLGNSEKKIGEAISHEAGHTLGLHHDGSSSGSYYYGHGSGETSWAPIMGIGYSCSLTQWSRGEYAEANNGEDDLAIIAGSGLAVAADDHGDDELSATFLPAEARVAAYGLIGRSDDVDVFAFSTDAGSISLAVTPAEWGANLDIQADLFDAWGQWLAAANPSNQLSAGITSSVPAGAYYLRVRGAGLGAPATGYSGYASLGQYQVLAQLVSPAGHVAPVAVADALVLEGEAPLAVQFDGSQSFDQDGAVTGFHWSFGDGATADLSNPSHVYMTRGTHTAVLTVTDNQGYTDSNAVVVVVRQTTANAEPTEVTVKAAPPEPATVKVADVQLLVAPSYSKRVAFGLVYVTDNTGAPVPGVRVVGRWSGAVKATSQAVTDHSGMAVLRSPKVRRGGPIALTVMSLSKPGYAPDISRSAGVAASLVLP